MNIAQERNYSRESREWFVMTIHRAGSHTAPNAIHIGSGYMVGGQGYPIPVLRWVAADGTEKGRYLGDFEPNAPYEEGDRVEARAVDLANIQTFYVRYNQVKELGFNLGDLENTRTIGLRNNNPSGLGALDLTRLHFLENLDLSGAWSVTDIDVSPQAPIDFYYVQNTSITTAVKDKLIQAAVDSGILNGTMSYDGRPSFDATANYNTLVDRGWNMSLAPPAATVEKLGDTSAGTSNGVLIGGSHRVIFRAIGADGVTVLDSGSFSYTHPGDLGPFENNGWIETEYYHPSILDLKVEGKQLKSLFLSHLTSLQFGYFANNNIPSVDISQITNVETLHLANNPITSFTGASANPMLTDLDLQGTNVTATGIDAILADLNINGKSNGTFLYSVRPTEAAWNDYQALLDRNWTLSLAPMINATATPSVIGLIVSSETATVAAQDIIPVTVGVSKQAFAINQFSATASAEAHTTASVGTQNLSLATSSVAVAASAADSITVSALGFSIILQDPFIRTVVDNKPEKPTGITFTNITDSSVRINWTDTARADFYAIRYMGDDGNWNGAGYGTTTLYFDWTGLTPGKTYEIQVRAINDYGETVSDSFLFSTTGVQRVPDPPTGLNKTSSQSGELNYAWDAMPGADSYDVRVTTYDASWNEIPIRSYSTTATSGGETGLNDGKQYNVYVASVNEAGASAESSIYTAPGTLTAPDITITATTSNSITFEWSGGSGGTAYELKYNTSENETGVMIDSTAGASGTYTHTGLSSGIGYGYWIEAVNASGGRVWGWGDSGAVGIYYISPNGSDDYTGATPSAAWKTLDKLNKFPIHAGATIRLEGGAEFSGEIKPTLDNLTFESYGTGKAIVNSFGITAFNIINVAGTYIDNLVIKGSGSGDNTGYGIYAENNQAGDTKLEGLTVVNCEITGFGMYGINFVGANGKSGFNNVLIDNTIVHDILRGGIASWGVFSTTATTYSHTNVLVQNTQTYFIHGDSNYTSSHSGNGIVLADVQNGTIDNCIAHDNAANSNWSSGGAVGIWFYDSDNVTIQHCEAYNIKSGLTNQDGGGFDLDGGVTNGKIQYCYAHDCEGPGILVGQFGSARPMDNITVRYNVLGNNASTNKASIFLFSGNNTMGSVYIYNNTSYVPSVDSAWGYVVWNGGSLGPNYWYNNLLFGDASTPLPGAVTGTNWRVEIDGPPMLYDSPPITIEGYQLLSNSPLINAGADYSGTVGDVGATDYFGNSSKIGDSYDIGAHESLEGASYPEVTYTSGAITDTSIELLISDVPIDTSTIRLYSKEPAATTWNYHGATYMPASEPISMIADQLNPNTSYEFRIEQEEGGTADKHNTYTTIFTTTGGSFDPDYQAVLDYATANSIPLPSSTQQAEDNQILIDYKASGSWAKEDIFFKFDGTASVAFKLICWKRLIQANAYGSIVWSNKGAEGNGTNAYIDPLFFPDGTGNYTLNDASVGLSHFKHDRTGNFHSDYGVYSGSGYIYYTPTRSGNALVSVNDKSVINTSGAMDEVGLSNIVRISSSTIKRQRTFYSNGEDALSSTSLPSYGAFILARNTEGTANAFSTAGIAYVTAGGAKTDSEFDAAKRALKLYGLDEDYNEVMHYAGSIGAKVPKEDVVYVDNQVMLDYKATGAWLRDDVLFKFSGTADPSFKLICWKRKVQATAYGSLTWSTDGVKGNGANAWINPGYIPANGGQWSLTNRGVGYRSFFEHTNGWTMLTGIYANDVSQRWWLIPNYDSGDRSREMGAAYTSLPKATGIGQNTYSYESSTGTVTWKGPAGTGTVAFAGGGTQPASGIGILCRLDAGGGSLSYTDEGIGYFATGSSRHDIHTSIAAITNL